jgi:hypothetical protein
MAMRNVQKLNFSRGSTETGLTAAKKLFGLEHCSGIRDRATRSEIVERVSSGNFERQGMTLPRCPMTHNSIMFTPIFE